MNRKLLKNLFDLSPLVCSKRSFRVSKNIDKLSCPSSYLLQKRYFNLKNDKLSASQEEVKFRILTEQKFFNFFNSFFLNLKASPRAKEKKRRNSGND